MIDEGSALGVVDKSDPFIAETRREAAGRVDTDRTDLPSLAADARASGATLKTLVVAGDTFLSYDQPAEAEEFYTKALGMTGVETPLVLTRLGIAQYDQGKYAEAIETFKKVEGARKDIANLWAIYTAQKAGA
ncbi:MAG: tetratricopeptide repeat protein [Erythrobacter sp.]|nr:tetratricopeptide repeat protein [Erythrobacter sp.]